MKLDFDAAAKTYGLPGYIGGEQAVSVFVTPSVLKEFGREEGGSALIPASIGDILSKTQSGAGVLTRPGVETGVTVSVKLDKKTIDVPVTGTRSILATMRKIVSAQKRDDRAVIAAEGLNVVMQAIAFFPRPKTDISSRSDAWRYILGGPMGSGFVRSIDDVSFVRAMETITLKRRLSLNNLVEAVEPYVAIETAFNGTMEMIESYETEALQLLMEDRNFANSLRMITGAEIEEMTIWQVISGHEDALCSAVNDAKSLHHDWSDWFSHVFHQNMTKSNPNAEYNVTIASAMDLDMAVIVSDTGAMIITWPSVTRNLLVNMRSVPTLTISRFEVPTAEEAHEIRNEAEALPAQTPVLKKKSPALSEFSVH